MIINVAGAGAGKTTGLAEEIIAQHGKTNCSKNIYCIAFTNNAVDSIRKKLALHYKIIPKNIIACTIHSFLYQEFISPYYFILFGRHYKSVSTIELPSNPAFRNKKIADLDKKDLLHIQSIPEKAKWIIVRKSTDKKREKDIRLKIIKTFLAYCETIFVDEAQDIDSNMKEIFLELDTAGCKLILKGDPKQDMRGHGCFRELIKEHKDYVTYDATCHRCPEKHLQITNRLISVEEQQISPKDGGIIQVEFESDVSISDIVSKSYDMKYIYQKNDRISTHYKKHNTTKFETLQNELYDILSTIQTDVKTLEIMTYNYAYAMIKLYDSKISVKNIMNRLINHTGQLSNQQYASVCSVLDNQQATAISIPVVNSIESIKGLEGSNCLFILTSELAAYLFGKKEDENKIKNALYVALTRSCNSLTIYITQEVECDYGRDFIKNFFFSDNDI